MLEKQEQLLTEEVATPENKPYKLKRSFRPGPNWLAALAALALAALYGRVALFNLTTGVVGGDLDGYENLWNDHWVRTGLLELGRNPFFFTDYLYYPTGISLRYHTLNPLNGLFALPFWPLFGPVATTNLKFVVSLALTTFCAYLLIKDLVGQALPAFAGASVFTYANDQLIGFFSFGQAEKLAAWWFPLYLFVLLRAVRHSRWTSLGYGAAAVVTLLAMALTDWQFVLYAVLVTVGYFVFNLFTRQSWRVKRALFLKLAAIGGSFGGIVLVPLVLPMLREASENPWLSVSEQAVFRSRALSQFFELGTGNPGYLVLGVTVAGLVLLWRRRKNTPVEERRQLAFWGIASALACLMALGPRLWLRPPDLQKVPADAPTDIPLLYALIYKLPVLNIGRDPERFYIIALLGFGILLAFALRELLPLANKTISALIQNHLSPNGEKSLAPKESKITRPRMGENHLSPYGGKSPVPVWGKIQNSLLVIALLTITLSGFMLKSGEAQADPPDWPAFYYTLAQDKEDYAIMELPLFTEKGRGENTYEAYQSIHGKRRMGGRLARDHKLTNPNNFAKRATLFRDFFWLHRNDKVEHYRPFKTADFVAAPDYKEWSVPLLNYYNIRYIILYPEALQETSPQAQVAAEQMVRRALGNDAKPVYEDAKLIAYRVPKGSPPAKKLFIDTGSTGWYAAEPGPDNLPYRWADTCEGQSEELLSAKADQERINGACRGSAELIIFNLSEQKRRAKIQFTVFNYQQPRTINIAINGYQADSFRLESGASKEVTLELDIPAGRLLPAAVNLLTISSPEVPVVVNTPQDKRVLSFGLKAVNLTESTP